VEGQLAAIWAEDEITDIHRDSGEFFRVSTCGRHPVNIRAREFVVGFVDAPREKVNAGAIVAPDELTLVEVPVGQLHGLGKFLRSCRHLE
jgi:hypothetical protein